MLSTTALVTAIMLVLASLVSSPIIDAMTPEQQQLFNLGIGYFNIQAGSSADCATGAGVPNLTGSGNTQQTYNFLVSKGLSSAQAAAITGNLLWESGGALDPTAQQNGSKNPNPIPNVGFGIAQWTDSGRQQGLIKFAQGNNGSVDSLAVQLGYLWQELTSNYPSVLTHLKAATTLADAVNQFMGPDDTHGNPVVLTSSSQRSGGYENPGSPHGQDRLNNATAVLQQFGGGSGGAGTDVGAGDACGGGAVAGSIVQTALNYAWPSNGHGPNESDATPSYQVAMPKFNGSTGDQPFSDCGVFVSTVMIASGADPNYPKRGTPNQEAYLEAHPELYQHLPTPTDTSGLQPGDILINSTHTYIFVGSQPNGYNSVGASLGDHVPQATGFFQESEPFQAFRPLSGGSQQQ